MYSSLTRKPPQLYISASCYHFRCATTWSILLMLQLYTRRRSCNAPIEFDDKQNVNLVEGKTLQSSTEKTLSSDNRTEGYNLQTHSWPDRFEILYSQLSLPFLSSTSSAISTSRCDLHAEVRSQRQVRFLFTDFTNHSTQVPDVVPPLKSSKYSEVGVLVFIFGFHTRSLHLHRKSPVCLLTLRLFLRLLTLRFNLASAWSSVSRAASSQSHCSNELGIFRKIWLKWSRTKIRANLLKRIRPKVPRSSPSTLILTLCPLEDMVKCLTPHEWSPHFAVLGMISHCYVLVWVNTGSHPASTSINSLFASCFLRSWY